MNDGQERRCALPGCDVEIEQVPGRAARKYCSAAHRANARRMRLEQSLRSEDNLVGSGPAGGIDSESFFDQVLRQVDPAFQQLESDLPRVDPLGGASSAVGPSGAPVEGREPRRVPRPLDKRVARAPVFSSPPTQDAASAADRRKRRQAAQLVRRRAVAVLGAFGILTGGGGWVVANQPAAPLARPEPREPGQVDLAAWAAEANIALAEVNRQLDIVAQTKQLWDSHPLSRRAAQQPRVVAELLARKTLLEQQRTLLQSELSAYQALNALSTDIAESQRELGNLEIALASLPDGWQASPEQQATRDRLVAQRDTLLRQREARERELASLQGGLDNTARSPLPDTTDRTSPLASSVVELTEPGNPPPDRSPNREAVGGPPSALAQREPIVGQERQEVYSAAPPAGDFTENDLIEGRAIGRDGDPPGRALGRVVEPVEATLEPVEETAEPVIEPVGQTLELGPVVPAQDAFNGPSDGSQPGDGALPSDGALPEQDGPNDVVQGGAGDQQAGAVGRTLRVGNVEIGHGVVRAGDIEVGEGRVRVGDLEVRDGSVRLGGREIGRGRDREALDEAVGPPVRMAGDAVARARMVGSEPGGSDPTVATRAGTDTETGRTDSVRVGAPSEPAGDQPATDGQVRASATGSGMVEAKPAKAKTSSDNAHPEKAKAVDGAVESVPEDDGPRTRFAGSAGASSIAERISQRLAREGEDRPSRSFASSDGESPARAERLSQRVEKRRSKDVFRASANSDGSPAEAGGSDGSATRLRASRDRGDEAKARAKDVGERMTRKLRERMADKEKDGRGDDGDRIREKVRERFKARSRGEDGKEKRRDRDDDDRGDGYRGDDDRKDRYRGDDDRGDDDRGDDDRGDDDRGDDD
ncbi:MAG: hypothetical protein ACT4O0_13580 [Pseudonocardia sp.]